MAANNTLLPSSTFSTTITFVAEMTAGGAVPNAHSNQYQRWHSLTLGSLDTSINNTPPLDNVMNTFFKTEITFFERASYRYPKPGSVALVTGKFFFTKGTPEPEIRVRADPIRVLPGSETSDNIIELFPPVVNLIGVAGSLWETHHSGARSFDLTCISYNFDTSFGKTNPEMPKTKTVDFTLRCFLDAGPRFRSIKQPQPGSIIHVIGQLCGTFSREELECPAMLITDFDIITSPPPTTKSSFSISTPINTPPRPSRLKFGPATSHSSPISPATFTLPSEENNDSSSRSISTPALMSTLPAEESQDESSDTLKISTTPASKHSSEVVDDTISDSEDTPRSSKRRRILSAKAKSME